MTASTTTIRKLARIRIVTADLAAAERFYRESFGFRRRRESAHAADGGDAGAAGAADVRARSIVLELGREELELVCFDPPGRAYPRDARANDASFQHIAIVVRDIRAQYDVLLRGGAFLPISTDGPEHLPPNTGGVTVFKFRDPEGHPIELSEFPPGVGAPRWRTESAQGNCLGIDHSAITVADVDRSIEFYCGVLGLRLTSRSVNRGVEQDRLDGLRSDGVDIVTLATDEGEAGPHLELLGYRPRGRDDDAAAPTDVAATRLTFVVEDVASLLAPLRSRGSLVCEQPGSGDDGSTAALARDPDGHLLLLTG